MRWEDQSEAVPLPAAAAFLATLDPADGQRLLALENEQPRVVVSAQCLRSMREHLDTSSDELGGLLVGRAYRSVGARETHVIVAERSVASRVFDSTGVSLRMETEIWDRARPLLDAGALVVGWYHSHPNLGAFFSDTDRATQRSFFRNPFSVGIVIDPVRDEMRAFVGPDSTRVPEENLVVVECP
jgi:proteasome lid subunit RPN8/RPN11